MKKCMMKMLIGIMFFIPVTLLAESAKGLNVILTAKDAQTQMMAMVLSVKTLTLKKEVRLTLCSNAGDLAVKGMKSPVLKPVNKSPKMLLKAIIKNGGSVQVCPLYLPNASKDKSVLLKGITVANPVEMAKSLLDQNYTTLSY